MKRRTIQTGELVLGPDILTIQKNVNEASAFLSWTALGTGGVVQGLVISPTSPISNQVVMGIGSMYQQTAEDPTQWAALPADTADVLVFQGINKTAVTLPTAYAAPTGANQQIPYLLEAQLVVTDSNPQLLPFLNPSNPQQPLYGLGGTGSLLDIDRDYIITTQVLTGSTFTAPSISSSNFASSTTGGSLPNGTYYLTSTYVDGNGESQVSNEVAVTLSGGTSTQSITYTSPAFPAGVTQTNLYASTTSGGELLSGDTTASGGTIVVASMPASTAKAEPKYAAAPPTSSGWIPLAVITQNTGESAVSSTNIFDLRPTVQNLAQLTAAVNTLTGSPSGGSSSEVNTISSSSSDLLVNNGAGPAEGNVTLSLSNVDAATLGGQAASEIETAAVNQVLAEVPTKIIAGTNISVSPSSGIGNVTISAAGTAAESVAGSTNSNGTVYSNNTTGTAETGAVTLSLGTINASTLQGLTAAQIEAAAASQAGSGACVFNGYVQFWEPNGKGGYDYYTGGSLPVNSDNTPFDAEVVNNGYLVLPYAGTLKTLTLSAQNGSGDEITATLYRNGSSTALQTSVTGQGAGTTVTSQNLTQTVACNAGDLIYILLTGTWTWDTFITDSLGEDVQCNISVEYDKS